MTKNAAAQAHWLLTALEGFDGEPAGFAVRSCAPVQTKVPTEGPASGSGRRRPHFQVPFGSKRHSDEKVRLSLGTRLRNTAAGYLHCMTTHAPLGASLIALASAGVLLLSGCASDGGGTSAEPTTNATSSSESTTTTSAPGAIGTSTTAAAATPGPGVDLGTATFPVDLDRALAVADETAPGGTITKIELGFDRPANAWVWKIDSQSNTEQREIKIDASSARVIADERDQESSNPVAVDPRKLSPADALGLATALVPGSVESWALEFDDGRQRYSFDIRTADGADDDVDVDVDTRVATRS